MVKVSAFEISVSSASNYSLSSVSLNTSPRPLSSSLIEVTISCYSFSVAALYLALTARKQLATLAVMSNESSIPPDFSTTSGTEVFSATADYVFDSSCISFFDSTYFDETTSVSSFGD